MSAEVLSRTTGIAAAELLAQPYAKKKRRSRRTIFLTWLRLTHLYVGLWGAVLGLLFGATGILMNHRSIMKIPIEQSVQTSVEIALPDPVFTTPEQMSVWLQSELKFTPTQMPVVKTLRSKKVLWADRELLQPERWNVSLQSPGRGVSAEYFPGNRFVKLEQKDVTPIGTLMRLHMASGVSTFWVLLSDTIAGSLIVLSITGLLLWSQLHTVRTVAVLSCSGALMATIWFMWSA